MKISYVLFFSIDGSQFIES